MSVNYFMDSAFLNPNFNALPNYCGPVVKRALKNRCATNADCRLADWKVNEVNIVLKCCNRFPIPKTRPLDGGMTSRDLLEHFRSLFTSLFTRFFCFRTLFTSLPYQPVCKLSPTAKELSKEQLQNTWPS